MNKDSSTAPSVRLILMLWFGILGLVASLVVFFGLAGGAMLDWIAAGDPSPENRREFDSLRTVGGALSGRQAEAAPEEGISLAQCLSRAAEAEKRGAADQAELWLALDAHGRGAGEVAFSRERAALQAAGIAASQASDATYNSILPGYTEYRSAISAKTPAKAKSAR